MQVLYGHGIIGNRTIIVRRSDREAEGARLLSEYTPQGYPGFESPLLRHDDCTGPSNGARFILERALLGVECDDGVGAFLDDCIDTIGFFALSGRRLIVVD